MNRSITKPYLVVLLFLAMLAISCAKGGGDSPRPQEEANLVLGLDPNPGNPETVLGANYSFKLLVQSEMPPQGIEGTVVYRKDADNSVISSQNINTGASLVNLTINNLPFNELGTVTLQVKSKSKPTNTASRTFKLVRK